MNTAEVVSLLNVTILELYALQRNPQFPVPYLERLSVCVAGRGVSVHLVTLGACPVPKRPLSNLTLQNLSAPSSGQGPSPTIAPISNVISSSVRAAFLTSLRKATPTEQNHAHTTLSILLKWAVRRGYIERSPMEHLQLPARLKPRSRILTDDELRAVYLAADSPVFGSIVRLCILLGQRRSEIGSLRWDWIDREVRTIAFPAEVIKNNRVHVIPYVGMAEEIFASIPVLAEHLFPGRDGNATFQGWSKSKRVANLNGGVKDWTIHDLRRVFSTRSRHTRSRTFWSASSTTARGRFQASLEFTINSSIWPRCERLYKNGSRAY